MTTLGASVMDGDDRFVLGPACGAKRTHDFG